jgi:hypothetical protein
MVGACTIGSFHKERHGFQKEYGMLDGTWSNCLIYEVSFIGLWAGTNGWDTQDNGKDFNRGAAAAAENGLRVAIPTGAGGMAYAGYKVGNFFGNSLSKKQK